VKYVKMQLKEFLTRTNPFRLGERKLTPVSQKKLSTWVCNFTPRYEIPYPGIKLIKSTYEMEGIYMRRYLYVRTIQ
jgi:hypothetical protein